MFSRFAGAAIRALCVVLLIALPSVMLPATIAGGSEIVSFIAIAAAILTFIEYKSDYPSLIEFRFAPPFNRIRFGSLFFTVLVLSIICSGKYHATPVTEFTAAIGQLIAASIDFPFSPVRLVVGMLPADSPAEIVTAVRTAAGISYLTSLLSLAVFWLRFGCPVGRVIRARSMCGLTCLCSIRLPVVMWCAGLTRTHVLTLC